MKQNTKKSLAIILALLSVTALSSCGTEEDGETTAEIVATETTTTTEATTEVTATETTVATTTTTTTEITTTTTTTEETTMEEATEEETESSTAASLEGDNAWDLMFVDADQWEAFTGGDSESDFFPGYVVAYEGNTYPSRIGVFSGTITDSTWVGMSYSELLSAMGEPDEYYINSIDGDYPAVSYSIDGKTVSFFFYDVEAEDYTDYTMESEISKSCLEETDASVTHAYLYQN
jgi:hypothetical protein